MTRTILDYASSLHGRSVPEGSWARAASISIFGHAIDLLFASADHAPYVMPAFGHIERPRCENPSLRVFVSDSQSDPSFLDGFPWRDEIDRSAGRILMVNEGSCHMQYNPDSGVFSLVDTRTGCAWYHADSIPGLPWYERSAPMRTILHWLCESRGLTLVHAAAVACGDGCLLLTGKGGAGKSTTAVACALSGLGYLGDDYVVLGKDGRTCAASLFRSAKINDDMLRRLPQAAGRVANPDRGAAEKAVVFLGAECRADACEPIPVKAILAPKITGGEPAVRRIPPLQAFAEIASSTIFQMPGSGQATFRALRELFQDIPVFTLELSPDVQENVQVIRDFCAGENLHA
jgi:hypothetical protein